MSDVSIEDVAAEILNVKGDCTCPMCSGDGKCLVQLPSLGEEPKEETRVCQLCNGAGTVYDLDIEGYLCTPTELLLAHELAYVRQLLQDLRQRGAGATVGGGGVPTSTPQQEK